MKVWKSPILYLGILLIAVVLAAVAAPLVVNWDNYRADLEDYGRKLTGRKVTITGPISARLFPWPRLSAEDVHVANLPELEGKDFASAARIELRMQLAGLFSGAIQVESIDITHPVVAFERTTAGEANWLFTPPQGEPSAVLDRVKLDQIRLTDGVFRYVDGRRGGTVELNAVKATLAAPGLAGPWRARGSGSWRGQALDLSFNTGSARADEPLRFSLRVAEADASGLALGFDGTTAGSRVTGDLRIEPAAAAEGKGDAEGRLRPLVLTAQADASFEDVAFTDIQIAPQDPKDGGTLMSGSAQLKIGAHIDARLALEASRIDLDEIAGAKARSLFREGQGLAVFAQALAQLPADVGLAAGLKITALKVGGESLDNVEIALDGDRQNIRVSKVYANLPGRSAVLIEDGHLLPGAAPELTGRLSVESGDSRALASWLFPEARPRIDAIWRGSRGRFKAESDLAYKAGRLSFTGGRYELDAMPGSGNLVLATGGTNAVDLRIDTDTLDLDNLLGPGQGGAGLALLAGLLPNAAAADLRLTVQAGKLLLNGVEADDIAFDVASSAKGLELRTVAIGSAGGARLEANGLVLDSGAGNQGTIDMTLAAEDPRGFLHLVGALPRDGEPAWSRALGKTDAKLSLTLKPGGDGAGTLALETEGTTGALRFSGSADLAGPPLSADTGVQGALQIASPTVEALATLAGLVPAAVDQSPARVIITGKGSRAKGFLADVQVQALAENFEYNGTIAPNGALTGKATLRSTNATPLFAALGLPADILPSGNVVLDASLAPEGDKPQSAVIEGRLGAMPVTARLARDGAGRITGDIETGPLVLTDVLSASLLSWNGGGPRPDSPLATALPLGLEGELWITPKALAISDSFAARDVQIVVTSADGDIHLELYGKDATGRDAKIRVSSAPGEAAGVRRLDGKIHLPLSLASQLSLATGGAVADGEGDIDVSFGGSGRSPGGVLAALAGDGSLQLQGFRLRDINPEGFKAALGNSQDTAAIAAAFAALRQGGGLAFGDVKSAIAIAHGEASFTPLTMASEAADGTLKVLADLALGRLDAALALTLHDTVDRPAMEIAYSGAPGALVRSEDQAELYGALGVAVMDKGVAELERLRQEQERLAAAEAKARVEDEEKLRDYYAQRDELRARQRELSVHAVIRQRAADELRASIEAERGANAEFNKSEMKQRLRELRFYRRLAKAGGVISVAAPPKPKPKVVPPPPPPVTPPPQTIPDILMQPLPPPPPDGTAVSPSQ
jgi:uncharacterized protein involved in outer membrane biogenesis